MLFRRPLAADRAEPIQGTELGSRPFFSPDGQWVGFIARNELRKVPLLGGASVVLSNIPPITAGASWGTDGRIVMTMGVNTGSTRSRRPAGSSTPFVRPEESLGEHALLYPQILPGGHGILCTQRLGKDFADIERSNVVVLDACERKAPDRDRGRDVRALRRRAPGLPARVGASSPSRSTSPASPRRERRFRSPRTSRSTRSRGSRSSRSPPPGRSPSSTAHRFDSPSRTSCTWTGRDGRPVCRCRRPAITTLACLPTGSAWRWCNSAGCAAPS